VVDVGRNIRMTRSFPPQRSSNISYEGKQKCICHHIQCDKCQKTEMTMKQRRQKLILPLVYERTSQREQEFICTKVVWYFSKELLG
jgi:hypothetical protein